MRFVLTGPLAGQTIKLGPYRFVDGVMPVHGSYSGNEGLIKYLRTCYQAIPDYEAKEMQNGERDADAVAPEREADSVSGDVRSLGFEPASEEAEDLSGGDVPSIGLSGTGPDGDGQRDSGVSGQKDRKRPGRK